MKNFLIVAIIFLFFTSSILAQEMKSEISNDSEIPYREINEYPEKFTSTNVAARMVDGLGFRFYWASEGLREEDLNYRISEESRTTGETIDHIYGLTKTILNASLSQPNKRTEEATLSFAEKREKILQNLYKASEILKSDETNSLENYKIIFGEGETASEYPYWNMINGPIADAIYHTGQVVAYRRASGNPISPDVRMFTGKMRK